MEPVTETGSLATRLKRVRETLLRLTTREMADAVRLLGADASHVSVIRYETGERTPPADYVAAVAKCAQVDPGWLLSGEGPMRPWPKDGDLFSAGVRYAAGRMMITIRDLSDEHGRPDLPGVGAGALRDLAAALEALLPGEEEAGEEGEEGEGDGGARAVS